MNTGRYGKKARGRQTSWRLVLIEKTTLTIGRLKTGGRGREMEKERKAERTRAVAA